MFVVVHLLSSKKRIILPESFIHDLSEESLKNVGVNANHKYLIYWSKNSIGDGINAPELNCVPNFSLVVSDIYPPENDAIEACYIAQLKRFFSKCKSTFFMVTIA